MKHLYYVRHGECVANVTFIFGTDSPLTEKGLAQAKLAGKKATTEHFKPDLIMASPLIRARKTAEIIASAIEYPLENIIVDTRLEERHMGDLENSSQENHRPGSPGYYELDSIPTVEKMEDLQARAAAFLEDIKQRPEDTILLAGHAAFGRCLKRVVTGRPYTDDYKPDFKQIPNAEIFKLI